MRGEVESMGKSHQAIAGQMKSELEEPLAAFAGGMKERRKIVQSGIEKLLKVKVQQTGVVNKVRRKIAFECQRYGVDGCGSPEIDTNRTVCGSRVTWPRDTW